MPITNVLAAKPDVLAQPSGSTYPSFQQWGTVVCGAPPAANQLSVVNRSHSQISNPHLFDPGNPNTTSSYAPDPSGVETRYNRRWTEYSYYTA